MVVRQRTGANSAARPRLDFLSAFLVLRGMGMEAELGSGDTYMIGHPDVQIQGQGLLLSGRGTQLVAINT
jgi:hypothetical protein